MGFDNRLIDNTGKSTSDANSMSIALGANANTGKIMAEVNQHREFNPAGESIFKAEAADFLNKKSVFSDQTTKAAPQSNPEAKSMLAGAEITGTVLASDRQYSMKATAAADKLVFGDASTKKSAAA